MRGLLLTVAAMAALTTMAAETSVNLINNGNFTVVAKTKNGEFPKNWATTEGSAVYLPKGGPNAQPALKLTGKTILRQSSACELVLGEAYKLSAMVKTVNLKPGIATIVIHNEGWNKSSRLSVFPENSDWTAVTTEFKAVESRNKQYGIAILTKAFDGEFYIADVKIEPLSDTAKAGSKMLRK